MLQLLYTHTRTFVHHTLECTHHLGHICSHEVETTGQSLGTCISESSVTCMPHLHCTPLQEDMHILYIAFIEHLRRTLDVVREVGAWIWIRDREQGYHNTREAAISHGRKRCSTREQQSHTEEYGVLKW